MNIQQNIQKPWCTRDKCWLTNWNPSTPGPYLAKCYSILPPTNATIKSAPWISNAFQWMVPHLLRITALDFTGPFPTWKLSNKLQYLSRILFMAKGKTI